MIPQRSLSTLLSQTLVAFVIEFDNEFEHVMPHRTTRGPASVASRRGPWLVSMAMWANFMRYIDANGVPASDLKDQIRITNIAGMQRWGYVTVDANNIVRPTAAGARAQKIWQPLSGVIEERWRTRFGATTIDGLHAALETLAGRLTLATPAFLPVAGVTKQVPAGANHPAGDLPELICHALYAFAVEFEESSRLSMALCANALRVLTVEGVRVRDLPRLTGVSTEALSISLKFLEKLECVTVGADPAAPRTRVARLTDKGLAGQVKARRIARSIEKTWTTRYATDALKHSLETVIDHPALVEGLTPYPEGWRAHPPYAGLTKALIVDPPAMLPHYPMVSHRGGYPDGS